MSDATFTVSGLVAGDKVLVKGCADASNNGIYEVVWGPPEIPRMPE